MVFVHISGSIIPNGSLPGPAHGATSVGEDGICCVLKVSDNDGLEGVFLWTQKYFKFHLKDSVYFPVSESFSTYMYQQKTVRITEICIISRNIPGSRFTFRPPKYSFFRVRSLQQHSIKLSAPPILKLQDYALLSY